MTSSQIVARIRELGLPLSSKSATPAQSINRDLHSAIRRGDPRIVAGPAPGQFHIADPCAAVCPRTPAPVRRPVVRRGPRLPVAPLHAAIEATGGVQAAGLSAKETQTSAGRNVQRLARTYRRSLERGWIDLYDADTISVEFLRTHPSLLWGARWWGPGSDSALTNRAGAAQDR